MDEIDDIPTVTVPVLVDDVGDETTTNGSAPLGKLVRCVYFSFESSEPMPEWLLNLSGQSMPFFMLGLSGIVFAPVGQLSYSGRFLSSSDVEQTFEFIEQNRPFLIETGRIYLPRQLIDACSRDPIEAHQALRVRRDLFIRAVRFASGSLSAADFSIALAPYLKQSEAIVREIPVSVSPEETYAFAAWCKEQLAAARRQEAVWAANGELHPEEDRSKTKF